MVFGVKQLHKLTLSYYAVNCTLIIILVHHHFSEFIFVENFFWDKHFNCITSKLTEIAGLINKQINKASQSKI